MVKPRRFYKYFYSCKPRYVAHLQIVNKTTPTILHHKYIFILMILFSSVFPLINSKQKLTLTVSYHINQTQLNNACHSTPFI